MNSPEYCPSEADALARALGVEMVDIRQTENEETGEVGILDPATGDIIGSGMTEADAIRDALETVRGWVAS